MSQPRGHVRLHRKTHTQAWLHALLFTQPHPRETSYDGGTQEDMWMVDGCNEVNILHITQPEALWPAQEGTWTVACRAVHKRHGWLHVGLHKKTH